MPSAAFALLELNLLDILRSSTLVGLAVLGFLILLSMVSWTIIFSKYQSLKRAQLVNGQFLRAFRKANALDTVMAVSEEYRPSPLVSVFDFGYEEVHRQVKARGTLRNPLALERSLQIGVSEEIAKMERHLNWLATTAAVGPFIGLFGTVIGIIRSFNELGQGSGSMSLRAVGPGISEALIATAVGLFAAIPAAVAYNYFGHVIKEIAARMDDFSLEFMNLSERTFEG